MNNKYNIDKCIWFTLGTFVGIIVWEVIRSL